MGNYEVTIGSEGQDEMKRYLQGVLNAHHEAAYPLMEVPQSKWFVLRAVDRDGRLVGGALMWAYWGWADVNLVAVETEARGCGVGRLLMAAIEDKAREEGCTRLRVETFDQEMGFYQRLGYRTVGHLEDYPQGYSYYWLRKDLAAPGGDRGADGRGGGQGR